MIVLNIGATPDTEVQRKIKELLENTETKCLVDFKIVEPCETKPLDSPIKVVKYHLPEWFLDNCRREADKRELSFHWCNPTSGRVIEIREIRHTSFSLQYNETGPYLGVEITWHEDDQEYVNLDDDIDNLKEAVQGCVDLLDKLGREHVEETIMSKHEDTAKTAEDPGTVYYQISVQRELLAQIDKAIEVLGDGIYTILVNEEPELKAGDEGSPVAPRPELVENLIANNSKLTGYLGRLNSIIDRVRI